MGIHGKIKRKSKEHQKENIKCAFKNICSETNVFQKKKLAALLSKTGDTVASHERLSKVMLFGRFPEEPQTFVANDHTNRAALRIHVSTFIGIETSPPQQKTRHVTAFPSSNAHQRIPLFMQSGKHVWTF